ncbi:Ribosomal silencing factor [Fragilaria crotonensis]|nr:Ribosomal silencing factor [Fragilaria crotonensis]
MRHEQQTEFMEKGPASVVGDMPDLTDDLDLVRTIAKAGDGRKAEDIVGLQVAQISTLTSFMVFLSGNSRPQNQAIVAAIMEEVEEKFGIIRNPQGTADSGWMVLDYGSVMVHVMTPKSRLFYNVEGQWREGGIEVDLADVLLPNTPDFAWPIWKGCQKQKIHFGVRRCDAGV